MAVTDDFTGTQNASLDSAKWLILMGTFVYKSNKARPGLAQHDVAKWVPNSFNNDHNCQLVGSGGFYFGLGVRLTGTGSGNACGYIAYPHPSDSRIFRIDNGALTVITTGPGPGIGLASTASIIYMSAVGSAITLRENGPSGTIIATATDATYASGVPGIYGNDQTNTTDIDDWEANGEIGGGASSLLLVRRSTRFFKGR